MVSVETSRSRASVHNKEVKQGGARRGSGNYASISSDVTNVQLKDDLPLYPYERRQCESVAHINWRWICQQSLAEK
jgi:hypothetical protein